MSSHYLDFEKPIEELEKRIEELENFSRKADVDLTEEIGKLRERSIEKKREIFSKLSAWQRVQLAREPNRPESTDYLGMIGENFVELHGDRTYGDDVSTITGFCTIGGIRLLAVAQRKGKSVQERMASNLGCPHPEGYRKAMEKMRLAEKFGLPVLTLVNTPGAFPGIGAEERGQAQTIARNLFDMSRLRTPILSIVVGEGGSGGALGISVADRLLTMENSYLSVISPEGCATILWRDAARAPLAAELLRLTPKDLKELDIIDGIIPEPLGGAHRDHPRSAATLKETIIRHLKELMELPVETLLEKRYAKYRAIGKFMEMQEEQIEDKKISTTP